MFDFQRVGRIAGAFIAEVDSSRGAGFFLTILYNEDVGRISSIDRRGKYNRYFPAVQFSNTSRWIDADTLDKLIDQMRVEMTAFGPYQNS